MKVVFRDFNWAVHVPAEVQRKFRPHAAKREITTEKLVAKLLERVAEDNLVEAILDDAT